MEASHSGLVHHLGKVAESKGSREFESPRLRQNWMITEKITSEIITSLSGFDKNKMRRQMLKHYTLWRLIDATEKWAIPELQKISLDLLPSDMTEEKTQDFINEMALYAARNPYLEKFLVRAANVQFEDFALKVKKEGKLLFPDIIAYAIALDRLTKATYDNPEILENCVRIFKEARLKSHASRHMSLFHKIKLVSVERAIRFYLNYHKTGVVPKDSGRFGLTVNILEAVVSDYISGFRDNAKTGLTLAFHRTGSKNYDPQTGSGPSAWSADKKAIRMSMPMTKEWCDLYQTWNMAFVSTFKDFPYIISKLLIPQVANYQNIPTSYMYKRTLALYLCLNHASLDYPEKAKNKEPIIDWSDKELSFLWGRANLENSKNYNQLLANHALRACD